MRPSEVDEPRFHYINQLNRTEPILSIELEVYPEAKLLNPVNLSQLVKKYGTTKAAARLIRASEAFVRLKMAKNTNVLNILLTNNLTLVTFKLT